MLTIFVPGLPIGKGRPRIGKRGDRPVAFTPARTVSYAGIVALAGQNAMAGAAPLTGPLLVAVQAVFPIAPSWTKAKRAQAMDGLLWHTSKPDGDNVEKLVGDALNGIVWADDSQVSVWAISKVYGAIPGVTIWVRPCFPRDMLAIVGLAA